MVTNQRAIRALAERNERLYEIWEKAKSLGVTLCLAEANEMLSTLQPIAEASGKSLSELIDEHYTLFEGRLIRFYQG